MRTICVVFLGQCEVLRNSRLNLHLHLVVHVPLCLATAAVDDDDVDQDEGDNDGDNGSNTDAVTIHDGRGLHSLFHMEGLKALVRRLCEACTDGIEHADWLDLTTVGLLIDHNRWVNVGSIFFPIGNFFVNVGVVCLAGAPLALVKTTKTSLYALLSGLPV